MPRMMISGNIRPKRCRANGGPYRAPRQHIHRRNGVPIPRKPKRIGLLGRLKMPKQNSAMPPIASHTARIREDSYQHAVAIVGGFCISRPFLRFSCRGTQVPIL